MSNTDYVKTAEDLQREIGFAEARLRLLRKINKDIDDLNDLDRRGSLDAARKPRVVEVPEALQGLTCGERIMKVMTEAPGKEWTTTELAVAAHTGTSDTARTTLKRLAAQSNVTVTDTGKWVLTAAASRAN